MATGSDGAGSAYESGEEHTETRVSDPEAFNQTERLRAINKARERAEEAFEATMAQVRTDAEFDVADRQQILRAAVMRYLTNIEWLIGKADEMALLRDVELGVVQLDPPPRLSQIAKTGSREWPRVVGAPDLTPKTWAIEGIQGFLTAPQQFSTSWSLNVDTRHSGPETISMSRTTFMPSFISFNAFRKANQFLSNQGVDVDLAEEQNRTVVDEGVIEEVEQWRKRNV